MRPFFKTWMNLYLRTMESKSVRTGGRREGSVVSGRVCDFAVAVGNYKIEAEKMEEGG